MPTIVIASPKGGAGKSTTAVILGTELAHAGASVTMLDCDPNGSLSLWGGQADMPPRISLHNNISEADIVKIIKRHDADGHVVIVDLEGVASRLVSRAISQADLVLVPMRATILDVTIGARALQLIAEEEEALDRLIPFSVVFTMTRAIRSRQHKSLESSLAEQGVDIIKPELMERAAFSALFEYGGDLCSMPDHGNMDAARENGAAFAQSVINRLTQQEVVV